jgi:phospholipase/carboxylesterase
MISIQSLNSVFLPAHDGSMNDLMVVLHGRGDSPKGYLSFQDELSLPSMNYLLLQAPDDYYTGYSWYDLPPNQFPGIVRSRSLLEKVFHEIFAAGFKAHQVILFGFSQGCLMTLEFGARFPYLLKGYIGISGYCYDPAKLIQDAIPFVMKQGKWLITHGTEDDVLPVDQTRNQVQQLQDVGYSIQYLELKKTHTITDDELQFIRNWILSLYKAE